MNEKSLKNALRRAAGTIQAMHVGHGHGGINGEAITALATADAQEGETWGEAVEKARARLQDELPSSH